LRSSILFKSKKVKIKTPPRAILDAVGFFVVFGVEDIDIGSFLVRSPLVPLLATNQLQRMLLLRILKK